MSDEAVISNGPVGPCWIGVFDILGFKNLHERVSHTDVGSIVQIALRNAQLAVGEGLGIHVYADTILLYPNGDLQPANVLSRMISAGRFLLAGAALQSLPMRGAITKGDFGLSPLWKDHHGNPMGWNIWGKALIRAALLERGQDWHGGVLDLDVELDEWEHQVIKSRTSTGDLVAYPIPRHSDAPKARLLALNWPSALGEPSAALPRIQTFAKPKRETTLAFFDAMLPH
jgi:hypothetical protein